MSDSEPTVELVWCGPEGHISKDFGELIPGRAYHIPEEIAHVFLMSAVWRRQDAAPAAQESEE